VLARVWRDDAYAVAALDAELRQQEGTRPADARLATELVYGVLRTTGALERQIAHYAKSASWRRRPVVRAHMLMAVYSICFLERVPGYAAVDEAVGAIRAASDRRLAAFANAVLRKVASGEQGGRQELGSAVVSSVPRWLRDALGEVIGEGEVESFLTAGPIPPAIGLCLRAGREREQWLERLRGAAPRAEFEPGRLSPRCIRARAAGDLRQLPGAGSDWTVQEEGAQVVAQALGVRPGETVLDACAGRGTKALLLAEQSGAAGAVDAADRYPAKLERLRATPGPSRAVRHTFAVDWTRGTGDVPDGYDRVLVDAPCSGVGTLRRRPEIAHRLVAGDVTRLAALQIELTRRAASRVRPGGRLVYAVCSVLGEETDAVVAALTQPAGGSGAALEPCPFDSPLMGELCGEASSVRLLPQVHGTDGFFIASFVVPTR